MHHIIVLMSSFAYFCFLFLLEIQSCTCDMSKKFSSANYMLCCEVLFCMGDVSYVYGSFPMSYFDDF